MEKWVALLRAVNVGGHNKVPMEALRAALIGAGWGRVQSYIQSGNLVFEAAGTAQDLAKTLHQILTTQFDVSVPALVLPKAAFDRIMADCPYPDVQGNLAHGYFCFKPPAMDAALYDDLRAGAEEVTIKGAVIWLYAPDGVGTSKLAKDFDKVFPGTLMTGRNLNTIRKLTQMLDG